MKSTKASSTKGDGGAVERAQEMRASLGARRDVEEMLAEASQLRTNAAVEADALVEEAQQISEALISESRAQAGHVTGEARERADGILARARVESDESAAKTRAEAADIIERAHAEAELSQSLIDDAEAAISLLGAHLESAMASVGQTLAALTELRSREGRPAVEPIVEDEAGPAYSSVPPPAVAAQAPAFAVPADADTADEAETGPGADPSELSLAERFPEPAMAEAPSPDPDFVVIPESERPALAEVPTSALTAVPEPTDPEISEVPTDADLEETTETQRAGAATQAAEPKPVKDRTLEATPSDERPSQDPDPDSDPASRPLGWLFRSAQ